MPDIKSPVGSNGAVNLSADVLAVQTLLNLVPVSAGGSDPALDLDGWCSTHTVNAIVAFQKLQFGTSDGRVDPSKKTITRLNELANGPGTRPVPLPDLDPAELASRSIPEARTWAASAIKALADLDTSSTDAINLRALQAHFKIAPSDKPRLSAIKQNFEKALALLERGKTPYRSVSRKQMQIDTQGHPAPGYTFQASQTICWSPLFHSWSTQPRPGLQWTGNGEGPKCRVAMVLHEPIHAVDPKANYDEPEWQPAYLTISADRSLHNAASYPSFAAHVHERSPLPLGPLYGAGRLSD